jgi:ubiquinone/menaquinone biosynthesis C-methylase UbiE
MEKENYLNLIPPSQSDLLLRTWGYDLVNEYFSIAQLISATDSPILELATGSGRMCAVLSTMFPTILTGDISLSDQQNVFRRIPKQFIDRVQFSQFNMEHLPFRSNSLQTIVCMNTMHEVSHPVHCIQEILRIIRPHGTLVLGDFNQTGFDVMQKIHKAVYHNDHPEGSISIGEIKKVISSTFHSVHPYETQLNTTFFATGKQ